MNKRKLKERVKQLERRCDYHLKTLDALSRGGEGNVVANRLAAVESSAKRNSQAINIAGEIGAHLAERVRALEIAVSKSLGGHVE